MQIIIDADADFVCLQEVIDVTKKIFVSNRTLTERYPYFSCNEFGGYGIMIFTKHPCNFFELDFEASRMYRSLLVAEPINGINGRQVLIATSHFESLDSKRARKAQMQATFKLLGSGERKGHDVIVCGDFNFDNSWTHETEVYENA